MVLIESEAYRRKRGKDAAGLYLVVERHLTVLKDDFRAARVPATTAER